MGAPLSHHDGVLVGYTGGVFTSSAEPQSAFSLGCVCWNTSDFGQLKFIKVDTFPLKYVSEPVCVCMCVCLCVPASGVLKSLSHVRSTACKRRKGGGMKETEREKIGRVGAGDCGTVWL